MPSFAANMARLAGVGRVDQHHGYASIQSLVGNELSQLKEGPGLLAVAVLLPASGPLTDTGQILQGDSPVGASSLVNDPAADHMVDVRGVLAFLTRQPFQKAACAFCALSLYGTPHLWVVLADFVDLICFVDFSIGINGYSPLPKINAQSGDCLDIGWSLIFELDVQEVAAISTPDQGGAGWLAALQRFPLVIPQNSIKSLSGAEQGQAKGPVCFAEGENPLVVVNAGGIESGVDFFLNLEGSTDASDGANGEVGRKFEPSANFSVREVLEDNLVTCLFPPGNVSEVVAGIRERLQRVVNLDGLFWSRDEFTDYGPYSVHKEFLSLVTNPGKGRSQKAFPPPVLKSHVIYGLKAINCEQQN